MSENGATKFMEAKPIMANGDDVDEYREDDDDDDESRDSRKNLNSSSPTKHVSMYMMRKRARM